MPEKITTPFDACSIIEDIFDENPKDEKIIAAYQYLIDTGIINQLQGFYGRNARSLIDAGICIPPNHLRTEQ